MTVVGGGDYMKNAHFLGSKRYFSTILVSFVTIDGQGCRSIWAEPQAGQDSK
jgi:hypothetical protein